MKSLEEINLSNYKDLTPHSLSKTKLKKKYN